MRIKLLLLFLVSLSFPSHSQIPFDSIPQKPFSYRPYRDFAECYDTLKVLWFKKEIEIGLGLPSWNPVRGFDDNVVFEGTVYKTPDTKQINTHVSEEEMPLYHYTHDFTFNAIPDEHTYCGNLLCNQVIENEERGVVKSDTLHQTYLHIEWETGLGMSNKKNPCSALNMDGKSCGFYSAGHERGDTIWNWPTTGDWVHVEGLWVFDRGHPPAYTEIHPMRFITIRRNLPEKIDNPLKPGEKTWATRVDLYASGEGGALYNNTNHKDGFVRPVKMGEKDYSLDVKSVIPKPTAHSQLNFIEVNQKGNTFPVYLLFDKSATADNAIHIHIPWKGQPDTWVLAKTIYLFWDDDQGKASDYKITTYKVTLEEMRFRHRKEFVSRHEMRAFASVGSKWFFLNERFGGNNFLKHGISRSYRNRWPLGITSYVSLPDSVEFRVHANSWENDGIEERMGRLFDPFSPCTHANKKKITRMLNTASPLHFKGCLNDLMGEVYDFYTPQTIGDKIERTSLSRGDPYEDLCICNKDLQDGMMSLRYKIEKVKVE